MNIIHEIRELQKKVNKLYCVITGEWGGNSSPTTVYDHTVNITDDTLYATIGDTQLTFNKNVSDFLAANIPDNAQIGETITTNSTVEVAVHPSGVNFVTINGQTVYKSTPNNFTYTPVSPNKVKELILYGKLDSTMLYLAEGEEGDQAVTPPFDGLLIKRILVNDIEEIVIDIDYDAFKMKSDDTWGLIYINNNNGVWEYVNRTNYAISKTVNITTPLLLGFYSNGFGDIWNGKRIVLKNTTDVDVLLKATPTPAPESRVYFSFYEDKILKPNEYITIVLENDDKFHYISVSETLTTIEQPVLTGNVLTLNYIGENRQLQQQNIDLSGLATIDVTITDASYNASTNILTLTDTNGDIFSVDLSEFSLLVSIDANGVATLTQEGVIKLQISKVGRTGNYNDLLNRPTIPAPVDISGKLDKPTIDGSWVVTKSGATFSYTDASNFGKNIGNSHITSIANSSFTFGANYTINTSGYYFNITNLPDKSADTTFGKFLVQNNSGQVANTNGKQMMTTLPSMLTEAEKNAWKTEMNGGWSTGTMSVAIISPPVVDKRNQPYWINLKGTNLNLPPTNFKIELCTGTSTSAATAIVIVEIPASQIQLYNNGLDLTFYYNFKDIPEGTYKLRLWNGVAYYLTSFALNVVSQINSVNLNNIVWSRKIHNNAISSSITESGSSVSYNSDPSVKPFADDSSFVAARITNELVGANEDFYMTVEITGKTGSVANEYGTMAHFIGLVNSGTVVELLNQTIVNIKLVQSYWYPMTKLHPDNSTTSLNVNYNTYGLTAIFVRRGGNWTIIITYNNQTLLYTKTGYTGAIAFGMYNQNTKVNTGVSANIVELYKF